MVMQLRGIVATIGLLDIVDIVLVAFVLYNLYLLIRYTQAMQLVKGLVVLLVATLVSKWLGLHVINWLLQKAMTIVAVALPVVFQPELRRTLERLGRGKLFAKSNVVLGEEEADELIDGLTKSIVVLAKNKIGALIIIERSTGLNDYIETGVKIEGYVSAEFLINIFIPNTPLHDGAVIIRGNRVMAAGCLLPLTENPDIAKELGTRHRAAIGISEQSDALAIVVSEETGTISLAESGRISRYLDKDALQEKLEPILKPKPSNLSHLFNWRSSS
jgi:diadenylate cyclase